MTTESIYLAHRLFESDSFRLLLDELVQEEIEKLGVDMRVAVRANDAHAAALVEGQMAAFESLKRVFRNHAAKCETESLTATP